MSKNIDVLGTIIAQGLLPNMIRDGLEPVLLAEAAQSVGIRCMEISCRRSQPLELLADLKSRFPDMCFGISSLLEDGAYLRFVQSRETGFPSIDDAVNAGADFLVSVLPFAQETYAKYSHIPIIPGVYSAHEAKEQLDYGASLIKYSLRDGVDSVRYVRSMFNSPPMHGGFPILLTGGMRPEKVDAFVAAGMLVCVCGFDLILSEIYESQQQAPNLSAIRNALEAYGIAFAAARQRHMPGIDFASANAALIQQQSGRFLNVA